MTWRLKQNDTFPGVASAASSIEDVMHPLIAALLVVLLLGAATALGLGLRRAQARPRPVSGRHGERAVELTSPEQRGRRATLLLFSSDYCSACPGALRELNRYSGDGIRVHEINLSARLDLARSERILQTP